MLLNLCKIPSQILLIDRRIILIIEGIRAKSGPHTRRLSTSRRSTSHNINSSWILLHIYIYRRAEEKIKITELPCHNNFKKGIEPILSILLGLTQYDQIWQLFGQIVIAQIVFIWAAFHNTGMKTTEGTCRTQYYKFSDSTRFFGPIG